LGLKWGIFLEKAVEFGRLSGSTLDEKEKKLYYVW